MVVIRKRLFFKTSAAAAAVFFFFSCVSSPEQPEWIERYPSEEKYYIGIGSSNDPVQSVAAAKARQDALANLASSISTSIISETETEISESTQGERLQSVKHRIEETVYQTLEGAEVVDSFYSIRQGYWIYMRISKSQLERQKKDLAERIEELLFPVYTEEKPSIADSLSLLQKGHKLLLDSPYFTTLSGELGDEQGNLLDLIERQTAALISSLRISLVPESIEARAGETVDASATVGGETSVGLMPVIVIFGDESIKSGSTSDDGLYTFTINLSTIPLGRKILSVGLDLEALGINRNNYYIRLPAVSQDLPVHVMPLPIRFAMEYDEEITVPGIHEMASALFFSSGLPFSLADDTVESDYTLRCRLIVEDFPRYRDNSLEISQARLIIQVESKGQILHTYQSASMKDGGLTIAQAHERTIKKLFQKLKEEQDYLPGLIDALPLRVSR